MGNYNGMAFWFRIICEKGLFNKIKQFFPTLSPCVAEM